ncbi:hypothetical protein [Brachybacterium sp.]|uniref:hypothetical protein n=1 Tax=Brachybacterium sp. TaxID=1891286 RepID=UPI002ED50A8D
MTMNTTPADPDRHLLALEDPAETLAAARLHLGESCSDSLILVSRSEGASSAMITRSRLRDLLGNEGGELMRRHLTMRRERGCRASHALIVLGDGYQQMLGSVVEDVLLRAGRLVLAAARSADAEDDSGEGGGLPATLHVRGAAASTSWRVDLDPAPAGSGRVRLTDCGGLREFSDTHVVASAVLGGLPVPRAGLHAARLAEIGASLELPPVDLSSDADPEQLFSRGQEALATLLAGSGPLSSPEMMTKCEQIAALLSAIAVDRLHWELLARCVEHGSGRVIDRETLLQTLVSDREWIPHDDVCAGGQWYLVLEQLRWVAVAAMEGGDPTTRARARSAWRGLTSLLVLLAWWNHRFATAGHLVDELRAREPESTLAPLLSRMTDTPIFPAWWPGA